ncbi:MAG: hypothetical protein IRY99_17030 [Isosphaeraceae bacterium]|nr:hypothetical protein [Isosphaeraceae bacterium]
MTQNINKNKISAKQKRQAESLQKKFQRHGMGRDEAENRALSAVAEKPSSGGKHAAGDSPKGASHEHIRRRGSDKEP